MSAVDLTFTVEKDGTVTDVTSLVQRFSTSRDGAAEVQIVLPDEPGARWRIRVGGEEIFSGYLQSYDGGQVTLRSKP